MTFASRYEAMKPLTVVPERLSDALLSFSLAEAVQDVSVLPVPEARLMVPQLAPLDRIAALADDQGSEPHVLLCHLC